MIVRDLGDAWQVVLQTDHADLSAAFARAWADRGPHHARWSSPPSATTTAGRSGSRRRASTETGKPVNFLEVDVPSHLAFYRAGIAAITEQDPYAGLLVSMHGAGIYRQRYGLDPALGLSRAAEVQDEVDAFVAEQEAKFGGEPRRPPRRTTSCSSSTTGSRSTSACATSRRGEAAEVQGYRSSRSGPGACACAVPLRGEPGSFTLLRRVLPKDGDLDVLAAPPQATRSPSTPASRQSEWPRAELHEVRCVNRAGARFCDACGESLAAPDGAAPGTSLGTVAAGRYELVRLLGEGGKKRVYLAHDSLLDREVALRADQDRGPRRGGPCAGPARGAGDGQAGRAPAHRHGLRSRRGGRASPTS